jgi:hypothetical protein
MDWIYFGDELSVVFILKSGLLLDLRSSYEVSEKGCPRAC